MSFGRQKNLVRRAFRPDAGHLRGTRRKSLGKGSLLELGEYRPSLASRIVSSVIRWISKK